MSPHETLRMLGCISIFVVVWFTWHACYMAKVGPGQSRRESMIEAWVNIVVGLSISVVVNHFLLPLVGAKMTTADNLWLCCTFTAISILRQYAIRRWFNDGIHKFAAKVAGRFS
jgi:hypothetical protein